MKNPTRAWIGNDESVCGGGRIADREGRVTITRKLVYIRFVLYQKSARCNLRCQEEVSEQRSGNIVSVRACLMEMVRR